jgi:hypothetical protein
MLRWVKLTLLLYTIALCGWLGYQAFISQGKETKQLPVVKTSSQRPLLVVGLDYSSYDEDQISSRVQVERLEVRPRKFGIFRLKSVNEVFLKQLRLKVVTQERASDEEKAKKAKKGLSPGQLLTKNLNELIQLRKLGKVQRVVIDGVKVFTLASDSQLLDNFISAQKAVFDVRKKTLLMEHAQVENFPLKRRLTSSQLTWDDRKKLWLVEKKATLWNNGKASQLSHVKLNKKLELVE